MPQDSGIVIKRYGYVLSEKGMGRAGQWKPKKEEDKRFCGKPGETKVTLKNNGDKYVTKIGKDGRAYSERHYSDHGNPGTHENPHDHNIGWNGDGSPRWGVEYPAGEKSKCFDWRGISKMNQNKYTIIYSDGEDAFESLEEFCFSLERGKEIVFRYHEKEYGIFLFEDGVYVGESYQEQTQKIYQTVDEALEYRIEGKRIREIITEMDVIHRNV